WIAQASGDYLLEVRSVEAASRPGRYRITLEDLRDATSQDEIRIAARWAFAEAERLFEEGRADSRRRALGQEQEALVLWKQLGDRREEAACLNGIGQLLLALGEPRRALEHLDGALFLNRALADHLGEAAALTWVGIAHTQLGDNQRAIEDFDRAISLWRAAGHRAGE